MKSLAAAALFLLPLAAEADPLADIALPLCSSLDAALAAPRGPTSPNCRAEVTEGRAPRLAVTLDARQQAIDIGPYRINNAFLYNGKVVPEVWALDPGDTLEVALSNNLGGRFGRITNLHTHGMIVSPKNASAKDDGGILGDNVFAFVSDGTPPPAGEAMHHDAAAMEGTPVPTFHRERRGDYEIELPADHPSGVFWYHPHPHGISEDQVGAGLGGLITVGTPDDYVRLPEGFEGIDHRLLMLKDFQLIRDAGEANWDIYYDPNSHYCDLPHEERAAKLKPGVCLPDEKRAWLFTVNGQLYPTITIAEDRAQLWRLANTSADVSYLLEVVDAAGERLPFQIVNVDGVAVAQDGADDAIRQDQLLMMPSARVEIYLAYDDGSGRRVPPEGFKATLRQVGFYDEARPEIGFPWPPIDLAEVVFTPAPEGAPPAPPRVRVENVPPFETTPRPVAAPAAADCPGLAEGESRVVVFDVGHFPYKAKPGVDFALPPFCAPTEKYGRFYNTVGSTIATIGTPATVDDILAVYDKAIGLKYPGLLGGKPVPTRGKCFNGALDTCVPWPAVETWWVVNASQEGHNFHIHQTRFQVLDVIGEGVNFTPNPARFEDNYPVLIGQAVKVRIYFNRPEQVGYFVYHCHVLQHEDEGMMAAIEVRDVAASPR